MFFSVKMVNALTIGDCEVLVSFKLQSSLDEDTYICKDKKFGSSEEGIYYSGEGSTIVLRDFNAYYFTNYDKHDITLNLNGTNKISLLHVGESNIKVIGTGELKFKEDSYVKKVSNGEAVYQFVYKNKTIVYENNKVYEGTLKEFMDDYTSLIKINELPEEYLESDYTLVQVIDYVSMTSVSVTDSWIAKHITTELETSVVDGYGLIKYVESKKEETTQTETKKTTESKTNTKTTTLKSDKVILISEKKLNSKYTLNVDDLESEKDKYTEELEDYDVVSLYDVAVYNGKKEVSMKDGMYTIKIKLNDDESYNSYKIIYVNDEGEIAEYIDGEIEDGYIVFKTTHLSQYGVIGEIKKEVVEPVIIESSSNKKDISKMLKVVFFSSLVILSFGTILFLVIKTKGLQKNKGKKKRA